MATIGAKVNKREQQYNKQETKRNKTEQKGSKWEQNIPKVTKGTRKHNVTKDNKR